MPSFTLQNCQTKQTSLTQYPYIPGVITYIALNYYEIECIELALTGLSELLRQHKRPKALTRYRLDQLSAQLRYLKHWLDKPELKWRCRVDGKNSVYWPITSSEIVIWLRDICQFCINEDAILVASADAANYEYTEYVDLCLEDNDTNSLTDSIAYETIHAFQSYYNKIISNHQKILVQKLSLICEQDYPLYPDFASLS
jgi:hypothetical protein